MQLGLGMHVCECMDVCECASVYPPCDLGILPVRAPSPVPIILHSVRIAPVSDEGNELVQNLRVRVRVRVRVRC